MTRHQSREQRVREILDAAAAEIDENGLPALTMDAVAARTSLSKGGVYRFFGNKAELTAALLDDILGRWSRIDVGAALERDLSVEETLLSLILPSDPSPSSSESRDRRVWLQLLPESLRDPRLAAIRAQHQEEALGSYGELARRLVERSGTKASPASVDEHPPRLEEQLGLGLIFGAGLMTLAATGESPDLLHHALRRFIRTLMAEHPGKERQ